MTVESTRKIELIAISKPIADFCNAVVGITKERSCFRHQQIVDISRDRLTDLITEEGRKLALREEH